MLEEIHFIGDLVFKLWQTKDAGWWVRTENNMVTGPGRYLDIRQFGNEAEARAFIASKAPPILQVGEVIPARPEGRTVTGYFVISEHKDTQVRLPCTDEREWRALATIAAQSGQTAFYRLWYKTSDPVLNESFARSLGIIDGQVTEYYDPSIRTRFVR